jgi:hypothetical protein
MSEMLLSRAVWVESERSTFRFLSASAAPNSSVALLYWRRASTTVAY